MVVFSPFVPFLCTLWEPSARFFNIYSAFTDQKKKKKTHTGTHTLEGTKKQEDTLVFFFPSHLPIHPWFCL